MKRTVRETFFEALLLGGTFSFKMKVINQQLSFQNSF